MKRFLEVGIATFCLAISFPIIVMIAALIRIESPGPALFRQRRIGFGGRPFTMLKFRTMLDHSESKLDAYFKGNSAEQISWEQFQKIQHDPRLTRLGRWLRRSSLDELPQLWNVLMGEMSLVGPRPILPDQRHAYGAAYPLYTQVRPGLTGLWQISGRNKLSFAERVELDVQYLTHWSLIADIDILVRTIPRVVHQDGAF
jgi:lipopolysaccharide/colanic/teichoic acid biosynthesis glycosyltransferase